MVVAACLTFSNQVRLNQIMDRIINSAPEPRDPVTSYYDETQRAAFYAEVAHRCQSLADSYEV